MAHLQYMPGDPRLVDQLVYELKSKGIFDQFRKDCIADVDTRPAYQNLRQRVESSVSTFLSRQCWQPDLNKNQLREKLRKHILDGNYLEQGVERIVDQVVNPKVASVFIPQVEDLVYNYLGITRKKTVTNAETSNEKNTNLLPTDLEAVSPGSVKSNDGDNEKMDMDLSVTDESKMEIDDQETSKLGAKDENSTVPITTGQEKEKTEQISEVSDTSEIKPKVEIDKTNASLPVKDSVSFKVENIPPPEDTPPRINMGKMILPKESSDIPLPDSIIISADIPLPDEIPKDGKDEYFKPINSDEDESSSDSSLRRNMSPLTPIRNFNNENSCDAQQAFENDLGNVKNNEKQEPSSFRFAIESKSPENSKESTKIEKKEIDQMNLSYQFNHQVNINNFNTPLYEDSSNSNNLQIDYESDANSKVNIELKISEEQTMDESKKDRKVEEKKSSHKSSHRSRDSGKYSSSRDKRSDSKPTSSRDSSKYDRKSSRDEHSKPKTSHKDKSNEKSDKKDSDKKDKDSSKHRSSHRSSSHKDSKSHKSSSQRHTSKHSDEKRSSSSSNHKEKSEKSDKNSEKSSKEKSSKDSKSSSHRSDKEKKSSSSKSSSKHDEKDKDKKSKKDTDDHYGLSGRGNSNRRSTDRDSNDGSSSSKGSHNPSSSKSSASQKDSKGNSTKSDSTSPSGGSPSDKEHVVKESKNSNADIVQPKPIVRIDTRLELPMASPPRLPFVPDVTLKKPKFAANLEEAKKLMKMRRFLDEEQKRMNQEAALLLEFQANVRPSLSQVYSSIPGPELEFACNTNNEQTQVLQNNPAVGESVQEDESVLISNPTNALLAVVNAQNIEDITAIESELSNLTESNDSKVISDDSMIESEIPRESKSVEEKTTHEGKKNNVKRQEDVVEINGAAEARIPDVGNEIDENKGTVALVNGTVTKPLRAIKDDIRSKLQIDLEIKQDKCEKESNDKRREYFEITVIAEELSESEDTQNSIMAKFGSKHSINNSGEPNFEDVDESPFNNNNTVKVKGADKIDSINCVPGEVDLKYFTDNEKNNADLEKDRFSRFLKSYTEKQSNNKVYLINCDSYEESVMKDVLQALGTFEIVNYQRNGSLKLSKITKNLVKNVNVASEVSLSFDNNEFEAAANELELDLKVTRQSVLSPVKSECSFELSNDYDAKIDEMVNNASRQEIMEIILGNAMCNDSPSKMPQIDYVNECNIESDEVITLKRKLSEVETTVNNNRAVLTPRKLRKMSASDQITSTTQESEPLAGDALQNTARSKYLGRARRVGLPRPRKSDHRNSPSSDKSVENYEQNTKDPRALPPTPNGKIRTPQRNKIQRYDTSDLYKPKLHYLSRRNNIN